MRLFAATLRKLPRRQATFITFGFLVGLLALIYLAIGGSANTIRTAPGNGGSQAALTLLQFPGAYNSLLSFLLGLGGLVALCYAAAIAGSEWQWGTLKNAVARGEGRVYYVIVTFLAIVLLVGIGLVLSFLVGVVVAALGASLAGIGTEGIGDSATISSLPEKLLRGWLGVTEQAALGFAIATFTRSQFAGVVAGIALSIVEPFATLFVPDIVKYAPFNAASALIANSGGGGFGGGAATAARLDPNAALVVVVLWLLGSLVVAAAITERAEIGG